VNGGGPFRIGELSRRSGVSPELLRAWERRYGLLRPTRSPGGLRLYSAQDLGRVRSMRGHLANGLAAAEAAAAASRSDPRPWGEAPALEPESAQTELRQALDSFDEPRVHSLLDRLLAAATVDTVLRDVVFPYLHELGDRWERGDASIAQEHFASGVLRGRLLGLSRGWGVGLGPLAVLACLPGERHDLGLIAFGLALNTRGWRIANLGSDTPIATIEAAVGSLRPRLVVVTAVTADRVRPHLSELDALGDRQPVALGGAAAEEENLETSRLLVLRGDPITGADRVTSLVGSEGGGVAAQ
jgi:MerR family transcriptional regulator, light-induced transcriptional regulator